MVARSTTEKVESGTSADGGQFVAVLEPEELPKGVRKEVRVGAQSVLVFWYRNELFAIESRSPAEGAYSEGFISAKLDQDYCIECPSTASKFDLRTGEIKSWYPTNPVLRLLTPQSTCRSLAVFPVRMDSDAIKVDVTSATGQTGTRGGADAKATSNNDVASLEPREFLQGSDLDTEPGSSEQGTRLGQAFTGLVGAVGIVGLAVGGTATAIYKESRIGLGLFWVAFVVGSAVYAYSIFNNNREQR